MIASSVSGGKILVTFKGLSYRHVLKACPDFNFFWPNYIKIITPYDKEDLKTL